MKRSHRMNLSLTAAGAAIALLAPISAFAQTTAPSTQPAATRADLPSAEKVIEQYVEAVGGEDAIRSHKSMSSSGTYSIEAAGLSAPFSMKAMAPDKFYMEITMPGIGIVRQGYNGEVGWLIQPGMGAMLLEGEMLEDAQRQADFYSVVKYDEIYDKMEVVEEKTFNGREAYQVRLVMRSGREVTEFFDTETHLLIGQESITNDAMGMGKVTQTVRIGDYREVGGVMIPHEYIIISPQVGMEQALHTDEVEWDAVDSSVFELPEEIKTLVEAEKDKPATQPSTQPDDDADTDDDDDDDDPNDDG